MSLPHGGEDQDPEACDEDGDGDLKEGGHGVDEGHSGDPDHPCGTLDSEDPQGKIRQYGTNARQLEPLICPGKIQNAQRSSNERTVEELVHQNFGQDGGKVRVCAEPEVLGTVEQVDNHSNAPPKGGSDQKITQVGAPEPEFLKEDNFEEFGKEGGRDHISDKREGKAGILFGGCKLGEEATSAFMGEVEKEEQQHQGLDKEPWEQVLFGGAEAFGDCVAEGH